jgi:hypothetical protein
MKDAATSGRISITTLTQLTQKDNNEYIEHKAIIQKSQAEQDL